MISCIAWLIVVGNLVINLLRKDLCLYLLALISAAHVFTWSADFEKPTLHLSFHAIECFLSMVVKHPY